MQGGWEFSKIISILQGNRDEGKGGGYASQNSTRQLQIKCV